MNYSIEEKQKLNKCDQGMDVEMNDDSNASEAAEATSKEGKDGKHDVSLLSCSLQQQSSAYNNNRNSTGGSSCVNDNHNKENNIENSRGSNSHSSNSSELIIKIISATYGACEGQRLLTGELSNDIKARIPYTRDVAPFIRALLVAQHIQEHKKSNNDNSATSSSSDNDCDNYFDFLDSVVRMNAMNPEGDGMKRASIRLLQAGGRRVMNSYFGDPCPGISKRLYVHYIVSDATDPTIYGRAASSEAHYESFAEHEPVVLRRRLTCFQDEDRLQQAVFHSTTAKAASVQTSNDTDVDRHDDNEENQKTKGDRKTNNKNNCSSKEDHEKMLAVARRMGRTQSIADFTEQTLKHIHQLTVSPPTKNGSNNAANTTTNTHKNQSRLRSATSEIVLPIILSFLEIYERVQCRLVCKIWRSIVRDWGIATTIDSNCGCDTNNNTNITGSLLFNYSNWIQPTNFTRTYLRGILRHSYSSLCSLFLSGFEVLQKEDIHAAIPNLRKLRSLDISQCVNLDDSTLRLLSRSDVHDTLEILYIKGLNRVTDDGVLSICHSCRKLKVLELSQIPKITDKSGMAIGQNLRELHALYMRDNYLITNASLDIITEHCSRLEELTLWGCIQLKHLSMAVPVEQQQQQQTQPYQNNNNNNNSINNKNNNCGRNLVSLNLWGCHNIRDGISNSLVTMTNLRSLIVSECHHLTDAFVTCLAQNLPQIIHLQLRYCKRITNDGVNAIANCMENIYSLDLSFCTRVTSSALSNLLERRCDTLTELRLQNCYKLDIVGQNNDNNDNNHHRHHFRGPHNNNNNNGAPGAGGGMDGRHILNAIRCCNRSNIGSSSNNNNSNGDHNNLSLLDLRNCGGFQLNIRNNDNESRGAHNSNDPFIQGMTSLQFEQKLPGFFTRKARWNNNVQRRLLNGALG